MANPETLTKMTYSESQALYRFCTDGTHKETRIADLEKMLSVKLR